MKKLITNTALIICLLQVMQRAQAQAPGSVETLTGVGIGGGTYATASESVYLGAGSYEVDGTWEIYAKNVWISQAAVITGTGSIVFYNPSAAGGTSSPTLTDGNNNTAFINVNIQHNNASTISLTDMAAPAGSGWADNTGVADLTSGAVFTFGAAGGHVVTNGYKMVLSSSGTLSGYGIDRYVETNTSAGQLVKQGVAGGSSFFFPVGYTANSYTPANINATSGSTDNYHVNVNDFTASTSNEAMFGSLPNVQRTWLTYSDAGAATTALTFYHYGALEQNSYNDASTEVYHVTNTGSNWVPGASASCAAELTPVYGGTQYYGQTIQGVTLPTCTGCSTASNGTYYTKTMCANISGNVWNDLNANAINAGESFTNGGGLFANLVSGGVITQSVAVNPSTGAYNFGSLLSGSYNVVLTNTNSALTSTLNTGWVHTGVNLSGVANTGNRTGIIAVPVSTASVTAQNFGILQCSSTGLGITASADKTVVCVTPASSVNLTSVPSGGVAAYTTFAWTGSGVTSPSAQNTSANPTANSIYSVTVTDALGCTATGNTGTVTYDPALPSIVPLCGTSAGGVNYAQLVENNGVSWYWTGAPGNRFYTGTDLSVSSDSDISHLQGPYVVHNGTYNVAITDANGCIGSGSITVSASTCLVVLAENTLTVTGNRQDGDVLVQWQAVNETAVKDYTVERSADGSNFTAAGVVTALNTGNSAYRFTDDVSLLGCKTLYYRIKQTGKNGEINYSKTIQVKCDASSQTVLKAYPNPVQSGQVITVAFSLPAGVSKAQLVITNALGQPLYSHTISNTVPGAISTITIPVANNMAAGTYFMKIISEKWISKGIKVIKQ